MKKIIACTFFASLIFISDNTFSQNKDFQLVEIQKIGSEYSENRAYMFSNIQHIKLAVDKMYITDSSDNAIRVFDGNGTFIHTIGGRGRGPGEFSEITDFYFDDENQLIVLDRRQSRVTIFDDEKNLLNTKMLPESIHASAQFIYPSDQGYLLAFINLIQEKQNGHFLHYFDHSFEEKKNEFFDLYEIYFDSGNPFEARLSKSPTYLSTTFGDNKIAMVPYIYTGTVGTFNKQVMTSSILGIPLDDFYEKHDWDNRNQIRDNSNESGFGSMSGRSGNYFFRMIGATFGLVGNSNYLLHFYGRFEEGKILPKVNIYKVGDNDFLRTIDLSDNDISFIGVDNTFSFKPLYLDEENRLYVADLYYDEAYPAVLIYETNLGQLLH